MELTGGLELVGGGDGIDEQLLQLRLALPLRRLLGIHASTLLDQRGDVGEGRFVDVVLRPNPRPHGRRCRGVGGVDLRPHARRARLTRRKKNRRRKTTRRSGSAMLPSLSRLARASHLLKAGGRVPHGQFGRRRIRLRSCPTSLRPPHDGSMRLEVREAHRCEIARRRWAEREGNAGEGD
jgi:hypothetical protein